MRKFWLYVGFAGLITSVALAVWCAYDARWVLFATNCVNTMTFTLIVKTESERVS